jgi:hypothetical protein
MRVAAKATKAQKCPRKLSDGKESPMHSPDSIPCGEREIERAEGRQASHPVFGETVSPARSSELATQMILRAKKQVF